MATCSPKLIVPHAHLPIFSSKHSSPAYHGILEGVYFARSKTKQFQLKINIQTKEQCFVKLKNYALDLYAPAI